MKKMEVVIDHLTKEGVGVSHIEKKPLYIKYALVNERIITNIEFEGKKHVYGNINEVLEPSPYRCQALCQCYNKCGGCHLSHMTYDGQLDFKRNEVVKVYKAQGYEKLKIHDCVGMENPYYYRNKVQVPVGKKGKKIVAGFFKEDTHEIVTFDNCLVQDELSNKIIKTLVKIMEKNRIEPYNEDEQTGTIRHILIRRAKKETMLVLITRVDSFPGRNNFINDIKHELPEINTIVQNINKRKTNVILGEKENVLYGKGFITDTLCNVTFKISAKSFYQINKIQCEKLYSKAIELAKLTKDDVVLDAYCGIGTIGLIAASNCKQVYGVEIVKEAIIDAKKNAAINKIENATFYCDDATDFIRKFEKPFDVVFIDPPRKGCDEKFLKTLVKFKPRRIIYISCNPETQARDVKFLNEHGYHFKEVFPFDMFPQSYHVETIVGLCLKKEL